MSHRKTDLGIPDRLSLVRICQSSASHQHRYYHRHVLNGLSDQNSQNRDSAAIQVKLDELIRVSEVHNSIVGIEHLTEEEIEDLRKKCEECAKSDTSECRLIKLERKAQRTANKAST